VPPSSSTIRLQVFKSVVFPHPEGPTMAVISPFGISNDTLCKISCFPKLQLTFSIFSMLFSSPDIHFHFSLSDNTVNGKLLFMMDSSWLCLYPNYFFYKLIVNIFVLHDIGFNI